MLVSYADDATLLACIPYSNMRSDVNESLTLKWRVYELRFYHMGGIVTADWQKKKKKKKKSSEHRCKK